MTTRNWPNGIGASLGDTLGTCAPLTTSGSTWFVNSATGDDSYAGADELKPFATLGAAVSASSGGDIIVLMDGHAETITGAVTPLTATTIVGTGSSGGKPTVKLTMNASAASMLALSNAGVSIRNIWFNANAQANSAAMIAVSNQQIRISDCYFECAQYDDAACISLNASTQNFYLKDTTIVSTGTSVAAQPYCGIRSSAAISYIVIEGLTLDNGTVGFSNPYSMDFGGAGSAITALHGESITLLRGADVFLHASTTGFFNAQSVTGAGKVLW
jgi:hypothetical protein